MTAAVTVAAGEGSYYGKGSVAVAYSGSILSRVQVHTQRRACEWQCAVACWRTNHTTHAVRGTVAVVNRASKKFVIGPVCMFICSFDVPCCVACAMKGRPIESRR